MVPVVGGGLELLLVVSPFVAPAPGVVLMNRNGRRVRLSARWRRKPLVAVFLRHFG